MQLNERLQQFREQAGYENAKLFAKAIGMPYSTYSTYESGKSEPKATALVRIASALHVSVDDLLGCHVNDFDKAAALFHESVGGQAVLNGNIVTFSGTSPAEHLDKPISKSAFINAINDCVKEFNQKTRPKLLKYMIIDKINEQYYAIDMMSIVKGIQSQTQRYKQEYDKFAKALEEALKKVDDEELTKILMDESYREEFLSKHNLDDHSIFFSSDHDDEPTTEKGPHSKE